ADATVASCRQVVDAARLAIQEADAQSDSVWVLDKRRRDILSSLTEWRAEATRAFEGATFLELPRLRHLLSDLTEPISPDWSIAIHRRTDAAFENAIDALLRVERLSASTGARARANLELRRQAQSLERLRVQLSDAQVALR